MATLKEQMIADLPVFFNGQEFAEVHTVDGVDIVAVMESEGLDQHTSEGIYIAEDRIHFAAADMIRPVINQRITIDGRTAQVVKVDDNLGIYSVTLQWLEG